MDAGVGRLEAGAGGLELEHVNWILEQVDVVVDCEKRKKSRICSDEILVGKE